MTGLTQKAFAEKYGIPVRTFQNWAMGYREPPDYLVALLERVVREDLEAAKESE